MKRLLRGALDAVIVVAIVRAALGLWWEHQMELKYGCDHG